MSRETLDCCRIKKPELVGDIMAHLKQDCSVQVQLDLLCLLDLLFVGFPKLYLLCAIPDPSISLSDHQDNFT